MSSRPDTPSDQENTMPNAPPSSPVAGPSRPPPSIIIELPEETTPLLDGARDTSAAPSDADASSLASDENAHIIDLRPAAIVAFLVVHYLFLGVMLYYLWYYLGRSDSGPNKPPGGSGSAEAQDKSIQSQLHFNRDQKKILFIVA
ncbi:unnamed protein product [Clonostachys rosea]|uniref:Uncharacterized protein n=1 Tax=Bionectria ochroleuca TaxID=29856 RepID=A0ABY6UZU8_BIOOC|nr:unnamed protein product [Clonostachys rosea]